MSFNQSLYTVVEDNIILHGVLNLSSVATFDINIEVNSIENGDAVGMENYIIQFRLVMCCVIYYRKC